MTQQRRQMVTQLGTRGYYQLGPAGPRSQVYYAEPGEMDLTGISLPVNGGISYQRVKGDNLYEWVIVAETVEAPGELQGSVVFRFKKGGIPRMLTKTKSRNNFYIYSGNCGDLSRPDTSWSDWVVVLSNGLVGEANLGDLATMQGADMLQFEVPHTFSGVYIVGAINFGLMAASNITAEAMDVTYGITTSNGDCGPENDGSKHIYIVASVSSAVPEINYSTDGGATFTDLAISVAASAEVPCAIRVFKSEYLIVVSPTTNTATSGGHYAALIDGVTGVPATPVKVTNGYVNNSEPRDMHVVDRDTAFLCADGGYIYKMTSPLTGVSVSNAGDATTADLARIHGWGDYIVAVGATGKVVRSTSRGLTWATVTDIPSTPTLSAVAVVGENTYWVGTATGKLYYTLDGGTSWTEFVFDGSGSGSINDIKFVNANVGYFVQTVGGTSKIFWTINGGYTWVLPTSGNRIKNFPSSALQRINRLAFPTRGDGIISVNNLAGVGLGLTTDGVAVLGVPVLV